MEIFDYVKKYDYTFEEKEFNEVDNLIFSVLSYVDYSDILSKKQTTIREASIKFEKKHSKKEYTYDMIAVRLGNKLLKAVRNSKRFGNVVIDKYVYIGNDKEQFCAMSFNIDKKTCYVAFEGTDKLVSGWKEDAEMAYKFPMPAHKSAINYLNRYYSISNRKLILGGHSKGGNLALVAGMYANRIVKNKIIKVYSNDGQGLRKEQIESAQYKSIENRYIHVIPYNSLVGLLLRHESFDKSVVIDTNLPILASHNPVSWLIKDGEFKKREISKKSKLIDEVINSWLDKYCKEERQIFVSDIFKLFEREKIVSISQIKEHYVKILKLIYECKDFQPITKVMLTDLKVIFKEMFMEMREK